MTGLRIIFAGTPEFAAQQLQALIDRHEHQIVAVYSQPDRPKGRGKKLVPTPVKVVAEQAAIPVYQPGSLKAAQAQQQLRDFAADVMVVAAYGMLLPKAVLEIPRFGCINVHASLLPRWRGAAPIERAIEAGDSETGITIMQMDEGLDTGAMLLKQTVAIEADDTGDSIREKLSVAGQSALLTTLARLAESRNYSSLNPQTQDDAEACYASKLHKQEAAIDWQQSATDIVNKIRAFNSSNVTYSQLDDERIKIWRATLSDQTSEQNVPPGTILHADKQGIVVNTGQGRIAITQLQLPGGKVLSCQDILNSRASMFAVGKQFTHTA